MAVAFSPIETIFSPTTQLQLQEGTVSVTSRDTNPSDASGTASTQTTQDGSEDYVISTQTVTLGESFLVSTLDDYMSDDAEKYEVVINDGTYTAPSSGDVYENVSIDTNAVTTTITDDAIPNEEIDTVYVKITNDMTAIEGHNLTHTVTLVDKDGNLVTVPLGESITVNLEYTSSNGVTDSDFSTIIKQVIITNGSSITFDNTTLDDFTYEGTENYTVSIVSIVDANNYFENVDKYSELTGNIEDSTAQGTILDGVVVGDPEDAKVYEDGLVDDIKEKDTNNPLVSGEEVIGVTSEERSLNITNVNNDDFEVTFNSSVNPSNLESEGQSTSTYIDSNGNIVEKLSDGTHVFTVVLDESKTKYTFTLSEPLNHANIDGHNELDLGFGYKVTSGTNGDSIEKAFNVVVVDSAPDTDGAPIVVEEDSLVSTNLSNSFALADEFRDGDNISSLTIAGEDVTSARSIYVDDTGAYTTNVNNAVGTITTDGNGGVEFVPAPNFSGEINVSYNITDSDGDTATSILKFITNPIADRPDMEEHKILSTYEDSSWNGSSHTGDIENIVALGLKIPTITDNIDQSSGPGDSPERLSELKFKFNNGDFDGAVIKYDSNDDGSIDSTLQVINGKDSFTIMITDIIDYHPNGTSADYSLTQAQYKSLSVIPKEDNANDIKFNIQTKSHEVKDNGDLYDTDIVSGKRTQNIEVDVIAVTDPVSIIFNDNDNVPEDGSIDIDGDNKTYSSFVNEDEWFDIDDIVDNIVGDEDSSESYSIVLSGMPDNSFVLVGEGTDAYIYTIGQDGKLTFDLIGKEIPEIKFKAPLNFSGDLTAINIQLKANDNDIDSDNSAIIDETDSIDLKLYVKPIAGDVEGGVKSVVEDTKLDNFLDVIKLTDTDGSEEIIAMKITNFPSDWIMLNEHGNTVLPDVTGGTVYTIPVDEYTNYSINPPSHSSTDYTFEVSVDTKDTKIVNGTVLIDTKTTTVDVKVIISPYAEKIGIDTDDDGVSDLTMNASYVYSGEALEDVRFELGSKFLEDTNTTFESYWSNQDDSDLQNDVITGPINSEYTYSKLSAGEDTDLIGAKFIYTDAFGVENILTVTNNSTGVDIPIEFLDSLAFIAPSNKDGTFKIKMQAKTIDHDEDNHNITNTQISGESFLTISVNAVADIVTIKTAQSKGLEDAGRDSSGNTSEVLAKDGGIDLNVSFITVDTDGSESFNITLSDIPDGAAIYYDGNLLIIDDGKVIIEDFDNNVDFKYIPVHNSNEDVTLKVDAQSIDGTDVSTIETKDIVVNIKGVADDVINNEFNEAVSIDDTNEIEHTYNKIVVEDNGNINISDLFDSSPSSYDEDGSETLFITITNLNAEIDIQGAVLLNKDAVGTDRKWVANANDIDNVSISKPDNYSGEIDFKINFQTFENDGNVGSLTTKDVKILVTPEIDGMVNNTESQDEDTLQVLNFDFDKKGDSNESLLELQIDLDSVDAGVTLYLDGVEITVNGWVDVTGVITAKIPADLDSDYEFDIRYKSLDSTNDSSSYIDTSKGDNTYDDTSNSWTNDIYHVTVNAVTDTATSSIVTIADNDLMDDISVTEDVVNGFTLTVDKTNVAFEVPFELDPDDMPSEGPNGADDDGSETIVSIAISGVPEGVIVVGGTYEGDMLSIDSGVKTIINSGQWTLPINDAILNENGTLNNIEFLVNGKVVNFNNVTTQGPITILASHQDGSSSTLFNSETFIFNVSPNFDGTGGESSNPMDLSLTSNTVQLREDTLFTLDSLVAVNDGSTSGDSSNFAILISELPNAYEITGTTETTTLNGVVYYVAYGSGDVDNVNDLLSSIGITPKENENTLIIEKVEFNIEIITYSSEQNQNSYFTNSFDAELSPISDITTIDISGTDVDESTTPVAQTIRIDLSNTADANNVIIKDEKVYVKFEEIIIDVPTGDFGLLKDLNGTIYQMDGTWYSFDNITDLNTDLVFTYTPASNHYGSLKITSKIETKEDPNAQTDQNGDDYTTDFVESIQEKTITVKPVNDGITVSVISSSGLEDGMTEIKLDTVVSDESETISSITLENIPHNYIVYYGNDANSVVEATTLVLTGIDANGKYIYTVTIPLNSNGTIPDYIGVTAPIEDRTGPDVDISDAKLVIVSGDGGTGNIQTIDNINITWAAVADGLVNMDPSDAVGNEYSDIQINVNANAKDVDGSETFIMTLKGLGADATFKEDGINILSVVYDEVSDIYTISNISYDNINSITFMQQEFTGDVDVTLQSIESSNGDLSPISSGTFNATVLEVPINNTLAILNDTNIDFTNLSATVDNNDTLNSNVNNTHDDFSLEDIESINNTDNNLLPVTDSENNENIDPESAISNETIDTYSNSDSDSSITLKVDEDINVSIL